ncbi:unnamed protein product [Mytilus coruscus]|uniref:C-type lectin domain-containing protein n=1 Tax=Mytilus coruscus TaxID=42192 RepID=A0A6J8B393_MYTCO|nr:unnamed protein product [Mytilus coruscus]
MQYLFSFLAFVEIIQQSKNWFEANNECVNKGGRLAHEDELHPSTCANKSINVWIDKYNQERLTPWIANMGCFVTTKQKWSKSSVLECYRLCKSTPFGYQEPWCSCEDETPVSFIPDTPCITKNSNGNNGNNSWLYNKIESKDYVIRYNESNTQAKSEITCSNHSNHLISRGVHGLCMKVKNTPEFWTGIKRFRYNDIGMLTDKVKCVYVRCQNRIGQETFEYCRRQLDGVACNINGTSDNVTTVKPSPESALAPVITSLSESSALHLGCVSSNVPLQSIVESTTVFTKGRVSMSNTENLVLPTSVTSGLLSDHTSTYIVSGSIKSSSISPPKANTIDMTTTVYSSFVTNKNRIELTENNIMHSTTTMNSKKSKIHQSSTVKPSPNSALAPVITSLSESSAFHLGYVSTNVPLQSIVENTTVFTKGSVLMLNTENLVLPTSVTSGLLSEHTSKHLVSASIESSSISPPEANTIDMTTTVFSSFVTNKNRIELMENNVMHSTTTMNSNKSNIYQSSTGLIVGISISTLAVLIIASIGICRLRHQGPFKKKAEDNTIPITKTTDPNYHDIDFDLEKETTLIENDSTRHFLETNGNDIQFRPTDHTSNGKTNIPNNAYAVMVKNRIPDAIKTEKNHDNHENTFFSTNESDNKTKINQPRRIDGNEYSNTNDTSAGHLDHNDPNYDTTTHVFHAKESVNESDYDHL